MGIVPEHLHVKKNHFTHRIHGTGIFTYILWVVVSNIFYFHPYLGKIPILTSIFFSKGLVQPPTSCTFTINKSTIHVGIFSMHGWYGDVWGKQPWLKDSDITDFLWESKCRFQQKQPRLTGSPVALLMLLLPPALAFNEPTTWDWFLDTMCVSDRLGTTGDLFLEDEM